MSESVRPTDETGSVRLPAQLLGVLPAFLSIGILAAALVSVTGPIGLVITALTACVWTVVPVPYALAIGHVALVTLGPDGIDPLGVVVVEGGFVAVLAAALVRDAAPRTTLASSGLALVVTGAAAWVALATLPLWAAAGTLLLALAAIGYAIHRYQLVRFGLVAGAATPAGPDRTAPARIDSTADGNETSTPPATTEGETEP